MSPVLPVSIKRPVIKRKHLRKYSWLPDVFRIKGSIIPRIIGPVLTVTIWAALVAYADRQGVKFVFTNSVLPLLSVVVGLILVFRNGTSYDRFWEGRKCFAAVTSHIRNLSRLVWVGVGVPPSGNDPVGIKGPTPVTSATEEQLRKRKEYVLRLLLSFAYATRHYLRGEDGDHYADYHGVLPASFRQRYSAHNGYASTHNSSSGNSSTNASQTLAESDTPQKKTCPLEANNNTNNSGLHKRTNDATKRIRPKRSKGHLNRHTKDASQDATTPLLSAPPAEFAARFPHASMPFPLIIAHELSRQIYLFRRDGFLETIGPAGLNSMSMTVQGLSDQLTAMERIANTPIPHSYGIHLKQCVTLYLFALPFTLVGDFGWGTVPVATVVAFTFMGIEGIATEIEQPFGGETTDLPMDRYCSDLREEIEYMVERLPEGGPGGYGYDDGEGDD